MQRRSFLGFLGGAVASAPTMAKAAVQNLTMDSLAFKGIAPLGLGSFFGEDPPTPDAPPTQPFPDGNEWAWRRLRALKKMNPWTKAYRERTFHMDALDPNTASLRSVSLGQKMRISRRLQVIEQTRRERERYHGIIRGWIEH